MTKKRKLAPASLRSLKVQESDEERQAKMELPDLTEGMDLSPDLDLGAIEGED